MERRILLVDDDLAVLLTLKTILQMNQFEVDTATSAREAVDKLDADSYHLVITDVRMETEDAGLHVVRAAQRQPYKPATALLTAYPPMDGNWHREGAQSVLVKPIGTEDLVRQIEALLTRREGETIPGRSAQNRAFDGHSTRLNREAGRKVS